MNNNMSRSLLVFKTYVQYIHAYIQLVHTRTSFTSHNAFKGISGVGRREEVPCLLSLGVTIANNNHDLIRHFLILALGYTPTHTEVSRSATVQ